jgi:hypothetical protein
VVRRILLAPSWWARHALVVFLVLLFGRLGWWQWEKGQSARGTLQNLFYGLEWPVFAGAVVFMWWKMIREELSPRTDSTPTGRPGAGRPGADAPAAADGQSGGPLQDRGAAVSSVLTSGPAPDDNDDDGTDEELAAYNRYLASLHEADLAEQARRSGTR